MTLVRKLIAQQFPQWADLSLRVVEPGGIDNRTFRLGGDMLVRMPSAQKYAEQVLKEQKWLPLLAPHLSLQIPEPIALGKPSDDYLWHWSIYRWIEGASINTLDKEKYDLNDIARTLGKFLNELHSIDASDGPVPGMHNFYRGDHVSVYDEQVRSALFQLTDTIDRQAAQAVWDKAVASHWQHKPVWVHGDIASGNLIVRDGKLNAVIDFGCMAVGDPACDLVIAWTLFDDESRDAFRATINLDAVTWDRAKGWALWKALITLADKEDAQSRKVIKQLCKNIV